ncbi:MAG: OmpH family outer membrane protein [candidate division WOR-3 bacterium]|nr:MAG: OmpH family outer membrane protein [candidate division WOR-3 bacterium]
MRRYLLLVITILSMMAAKEQTIGLIDAERIMNEYQATAVATAEFNQFVSQYRDSAAVLKRRIDDLKSEVETQKLLLSEEARLRKVDEIEALTASYNQFLQTIFGAGGKVEQKNDELMAPLLQKINTAIAKIAEQEGFQIVLELAEGVYYASSDLDITDLVVNELNLEYGPTTLPTGVVKKVLVVFPFREENPEASNAELGQICQNELYRTIRTFSGRFTIIDRTTINMEIVKRNLGVNAIDDNQAYEIGSSLLCDYIITGRVSKISTKIEYTVTLKNVKDKTEVARRTNSVTELVKLYESLNNDVRALIDKIQQ